MRGAKGTVFGRSRFIREVFRARVCKSTSLWSSRSQPALGEQGDPIRDPSRNIKTVEQGAASSVWCAISHQLDGLGGVYCENCDIAVLTEEGTPLNLDDSSKQFGVMPYAIDPRSADRLWNLGERLSA